MLNFKGNYSLYLQYLAPAPNNILWAHQSGRLSVGATSSVDTGKMIKFSPK